MQALQKCGVLVMLFIGFVFVCFYPRNAMLSWVLAVMCLLVRPSVTHRYCVKMAKCTITETMQHDSTKI